MEDVEGEHLVSVETLERIAQEIDDLEIMYIPWLILRCVFVDFMIAMSSHTLLLIMHTRRIKLETVHRIHRMGNFPRLSELLTEEELEKLLFRLVKRLTIDVFEDRKELVISARPSRGTAAGGGGGGTMLPGDEAIGETESRQRRRPRTCPSTMPSNSANSLSELDLVRPSEVGKNVDAAPTAVDPSEMRRQLSAWLNVGTKKFAIRHQNAYYVVGISFASESSMLTVNAVMSSGPAAASAKRKSEVTFSDSKVKTLVQRLESQQLSRDELVKQEIVKMLG